MVASEAKGTIWYGMHFYAGLAQYEEEGKEPYRVFLNENTIRTMDPTFAARPLFVFHVDEIETDLDELRKEADGWVVESFYNQADGKHWAKFIVVSEKGKQAIARGYKLSNCYMPQTFGKGGIWNGIPYDREITAGTYEHLAIVPNPRYEESVIMSPDNFKKYNEEKMAELKKLANHKPQGAAPMKLNFFKRAKVENSLELDSMLVELPQSKVEVALAKLINEADKQEMEKDKPKVASPDHLVDCMGNTMTVNELVEKHKSLCDEMEQMKKPKEDSEDPAEGDMEDDDDMDEAKRDVPMPEDDKKGEESTLKLEKEEEKEVKDAKKKNAQEKADRLRNAHLATPQAVQIFTSLDRVKRGKQLYGSK